MIYYLIFGLILFAFCFILFLIDKKERSIRLSEKEEFFELLRNIDENIVACNVHLRKLRDNKKC